MASDKDNGLDGFAFLSNQMIFGYNRLYIKTIKFKDVLELSS